jgi:uncharacterized protein
MLIRLKDIKEQGLSLEFAEDAECFPAVVELFADREIEILQPIWTKLRAIRVGDMIEVQGSSSTRVRFPCSRCLSAQEIPVESHYELTFVKQLPPVTEEEVAEEIELRAEEMGLVEFHGDEIDLKEAIQEQVILALPLRALCNDACRGLCPQCGANLNEAGCQCPPSEFRNKFSLLKEFKPEKK